ncbi:hypothetical protein [Pseudomonas sp.]|uniref:hypothetical protein n=1 Tax=Pseudomonas sp. TaxID=306 RepID=UPI0028A9DC8D|nr:hypothetical protein [Pseudomonas sp.]
MIRIGASIIALGMICSFPATAAEYYEYSPHADVMACDTTIEVPTLGLRKADGTYPTRTVHDCRPYGKSTPSSKPMPFINRQTRERFVQNSAGTLSLQCGEYGCALQNDVTGYTKGALIGKGSAGNYLIENGWYLDFDTEGNTVAYRNDVGPNQGQVPFGTPRPRPADYGKESCYDAKIASAQEGDAEIAISFDMMNEMRSDCGLPTEE